MYQANEQAVSNEVLEDNIDELITKAVSEPYLRQFLLVTHKNPFWQEPALGIFTTVLGISALLDALGRILNIQIIYTVGIEG